MTKLPNDLEKEFMQIVRDNWHSGAGEIIDMDKFLSETKSFIAQAISTARESALKDFGIDIHQKCLIFVDNHSFNDSGKCIDCGLQISEAQLQVIKDKLSSPTPIKEGEI